MRPRNAVRLAIVFVAYVVTARAGLALGAVSGFASLVWAPTGISLAAMLVWGSGVWPAVALGAMVANSLAGAPLPVALGIAAGNTAEAWTGASLLRAIRFDARLERLSDVLGLIAFGALASTLISASVGVAALRLAGIVAAGAVARTWRVWWLGDLMGALVVTPLLLVWWARPHHRRRPHLLAEAAASLFAIAAAVTVVFWNRRAISELRVPAYLLFPILLAVATRFGQYGAVSANFFVTAAAITFTALGFGPFVHSAGLSESLLQLQMLMGALAITTLVLGATVAERDRAAEAREEFLSVASHELRTPLTSLSLQLQFLSRALADGARWPPDRAFATVNAALRQSGKLARLINDLLDVSRITTGRLRLEPEELDLGVLAREVASAYGEPSRSAGISVSVRCEGDCRGFWDRHRLEQVIDNLLSNAVKYGGGKPIEVDVRAASAGVALSVRDHGIGIPPGDHRRIFDRYERAVSGRRYGGLGLGLWIARRIVEAHLGRIRVESKAGDGATFVVELPRQPPSSGRGAQGSVSVPRPVSSSAIPDG